MTTQALLTLAAARGHRSFLVSDPVMREADVLAIEAEVGPLDENDRALAADAFAHAYDHPTLAMVAEASGVDASAFVRIPTVFDRFRRDCYVCRVPQRAAPDTIVRRRDVFFGTRRESVLLAGDADLVTTVPPEMGETFYAYNFPA